MESLLGFNETTSNFDQNYKLVPWLNWEEWDFVRISLFSSSHDSVAKALRRIAAWRSRGCLPVVIEITASIVEIQQRDPHFSAGLHDGASDSVEMLSMLYTMAIMRLVNGVIEKTRKKKEVSIAEAAAAIDIPRMLIDIRHEGSHRELPSLRLLRLASTKALNWLKSYYWDPQKNLIPYQCGKSANVRKEIRSRLRELAFHLKAKQSSSSSSLRVKGTCAAVHGRNKFFSLVGSKYQPSKHVGSKKQITRTLKNLVRLYSFFSSDVVSVLLEFLLKASSSTEFADSPEKFHINLRLDVAQAVFDEWKTVITKFSKKEPELLLSLLKAVLDMISSRKTIRDDFGGQHFSLLLYDSQMQQIGVLSSLFTWLVLVLKGLKLTQHEGQGSHIEAAYCLPKTSLNELVSKCLHISDPENHELLGSALLLAKMVEGSYQSGKLCKLSLLTSLYSRLSEDNPLEVKAEDFTAQEKYIRQAAQKLEMIKHRRINNTSALRTQDDNVEDDNVWTVAKSWNPCPIGMLPRAVGSSGRLPVFDNGTGCETKEALNSMTEDEHWELRHSRKREGSCDIETMNGSSIKRVKEMRNVDVSEPDNMNTITTTSDGIKGRLLIDGVWQKVGDRELQDIKSRVGILVSKSEV